MALLKPVNRIDDAIKNLHDLSTWLWGEGRFQVLDAVHEVRRQAIWFAGCLQVRQALEQLTEHDPNFSPSEVGAKAKVRTSGTKTQVWVRISGEVKGEGILKHPVIAIC